MQILRAQTEPIPMQLSQVQLRLAPEHCLQDLALCHEQMARYDLEQGH